MTLPAVVQGRLSLPVIGSPMFIVSGPELVIAQCKAGIVGSFPALNARPAEVLEQWLQRITTELDEYRAKNPDKPVAPFAVNQIVHQSNDRLQHDVEMCVKYKVPIVITSLRAPNEVVDAIHSYGGIVLHDVINIRHAKKALEAGVDGLILVCAGAGGHAGTLSPFALVSEVRQFFKGPIALSGSISHGSQVLAAQADGGRFRLYGHALHRDAGSQCRAGLQADADRLCGWRHRLFLAVHRRTRQLSEEEHYGCRHGPGQPARSRQEHDELRFGRQFEVEGLKAISGVRGRALV